MKRSIGAKTLIFPNPVLVVGTYDHDGKPNAMVVAWGGIVCSAPPSVGISLRKATYTYGNIIERKAFTISIPSEQYLREADHFGIASGKNEDKFAVTKLTPVRSELVDAPFVGEFPFILECKLLHLHDLGMHTQFIGEILDVKVDEGAFNSAVKPDIEKIKPFFYDHSSLSYYGIGKMIGKSFSVGKEI